jgi:hypothetical protein
MKKWIFIAGVLFFFTACRSGRQFTSDDAISAKVKQVAVLPVQVVYTGNLPKNFTQSMADSLATEQGRAFQQSLLNNLLQHAGRSKKAAGADFQSIDKTNALLRSRGIQWKDIPSQDPDQLAKLLGVDAVVRMQVTSDRLMSDMASLGLGTLRNVLFWGTNLSPAVSGSITNKTAEVYAQSSLLKDGKTLWTAEYKKPTDWNTSIRDVMAKVSKKMAKGFPY